VLAFSIVAAIAVATARETFDIVLHELDGRRVPVERRAVAADRRRGPAGVARA
jgi:hypothetical protein